MNKSDSERGATLVMVAVVLVLLLTFVGLAVDVGAGYVERRRIQSVADAAALAGVQVLTDKRDVTNSDILDAVRKYAMLENPPAANETRAEPIVKWMVGQTVGADIVPGSPPAGVTGIQVTVHGSTPTFFANLLGITQVSATASGGGGYSPIDVVLVMDSSTSMLYNSCDFERYFATGQPCRNVIGTYPTEYQRVEAIYNTYCSRCVMGVWATPTRGPGTPTPRPGTPTPSSLCYLTDHYNVGNRTPVPGAPMQTPPPECRTLGVGTKANCQACAGALVTPWAPLTDVQNAGDAFIQQMQVQLAPSYPRLGLVTYGTRACSTIFSTTPCLPLTFDLIQVSIAIHSSTMSPSTTTQSTNAEEGLSTARGYLNANSRLTAVKVIVFLSDGEANTCAGGANCGTTVAKQQAIAQATLAKADGIRIYTIGLGTGADQATLQQIATVSGGDYLYAPTRSDLLAVYIEMFNRIKRLRLVQ
jgi:Flp pilus assembly protein TadG